MPYRHPGQVFLAQQGSVQTEDDVLRYVDFLRAAAQVGDEPPVDLHRIYHHFGMPTPLRAPLDEQQGILVDSRTGMILIKEDDPLVRQRFTEGHELLELLFDAVDEARQPSYLPRWNEARKEQLCDRGAAELLMPKASFLPRLQASKIGLTTARSLAELYQTSLLATLIRMMQLGTGNCALIVWHRAFKPSESKITPKPITRASSQPEKKLRIWWRIQTDDWTGGFIPKNKSIPADSLISHAYTSGQPSAGREVLRWGGTAIACRIETLPISIGDKACVLSLLCTKGEEMKGEEMKGEGMKGKQPKQPFRNEA